jgi:hypothetical protein
MEICTIYCDGCAEVSCEESKMKTLKKFDKVIKWVRFHVTLKRVWYGYFLSLIIVVVVSILYRNLDPYIFQIGTVFSIIVVYLVMIQSNSELRETTEKQVKAFVESLQTVCAELKELSSRVDNLADVMKGVQKTILESTLVSNAIQERVENERKKRKAMIKPQLEIGAEVHGLQVLIFDNRGYHLTVSNSGIGDALNTFLVVKGVRYGPFDIVANKPSMTIDIGPLKKFKEISFISIYIQLRDIDGNFYAGFIRVSLPQPQSIPVPLSEV